jgi:hypothetical protein
MGRMVRKQVYIEPEQEVLLKQRARALGMSEAELIRMGIAAMGRTAISLPMDQRAWADELAFIRQRAQVEQAGDGQRQWTREDLYAERLERFSR